MGVLITIVVLYAIILYNVFDNFNKNDNEDGIL